LRGKAVTSAGYTAASANPFRYRGYYYDTESGCYYLNSRYYNPEWGRFLSGDGVISDVGGDVRGYNLFAYCFNNPVNLTDENGDWPNWESFAKKIAIGTAAVVAGAAIVALTAATGGAAAAFTGALIAGAKAAIISGAVSATISAGTSAIDHRISTGSWEGATETIVEEIVNGFADGFMTGGIMAGGSQAISGGFKFVANKGVQTGRNGGIAVCNKLRVLSPNHTKAYEAGGTLIKIGSKYKNIRFDVGAKSLLHMNVQLTKRPNFLIIFG